MLHQKRSQPGKLPPTNGAHSPAWIQRSKNALQKDLNTQKWSQLQLPCLTVSHQQQGRDATCKMEMVTNCHDLSGLVGFAGSHMGHSTERLFQVAACGLESSASMLHGGLRFLLMQTENITDTQ